MGTVDKGTADQAPTTWAEIEAYFEAQGFEVFEQNIGSMMRRLRPAQGEGRGKFARQYLQRNHPGFRPEGKWKAVIESWMGQVLWYGPWFDDPISAYVHAEIENWGRP